MNLLLTNGYPYPYPPNLSTDEQDELSYEAGGNGLRLRGITSFQRLHTVIIEFGSLVDFEAARLLCPNWQVWGNQNYVYVLEAPTSADDGYSQPAIIAGDMAWCGYILSPELE